MFSKQRKRHTVKLRWQPILDDKVVFFFRPQTREDDEDVALLEEGRSTPCRLCRREAFYVN